MTAAETVLNFNQAAQPASCQLNLRMVPVRCDAGQAGLRPLCRTAPFYELICPREVVVSRRCGS